MGNECRQSLNIVQKYTLLCHKYGRIIQAFGSEDIKELILMEQKKSLRVNVEIA